MTEAILEPVDYVDVHSVYWARLRPQRFVIFLDRQPVDRCFEACVSGGYVIRCAEDVRRRNFALGDDVATVKLFGEVEIYRVVKQ